eukprot:366543-Chlamydomonas_euryale.AAC.1
MICCFVLAPPSPLPLPPLRCSPSDVLRERARVRRSEGACPPPKSYPTACDMSPCPSMPASSCSVRSEAASRLPPPPAVPA